MKKASDRQPAPVILFDGVCNLCSGAVQFVIARDPHAQFRFAALQSDAAAARLRPFGHRGQLPDSVALIEGDRLYTGSTAVLRIARHLRAPWPLAYWLVAVPRPLRDWLYRLVARRRYRWFGRRESCFAPPSDLRDRFLSG